MIYIDTEFNRTLLPQVNPVCASLAFLDGDIPRVKEFWTSNNGTNKLALKEFLLANKDKIFIAWGVIAEARFFMSLGLNPVEFKWIDLYLEYRNLSNHSDELMYGKQYQDGKIINTRKPKPKWERTEGEMSNSFKQKFSLAEATYKLLEQIRDTEHKTKMRDLIISDPESFSDQEQKDIQDYCTEDTIFLPEIHEKIKAIYDRRLLKRDKETLLDEMLLRGKYAALTAKMESVGYPIDVDMTRNFSAAVGPILDQCIREINSYFPELKVFYWNKKENRFSKSESAIQDWLSKNVNMDLWVKTDSYPKAVKEFKSRFKAKHNRDPDKDEIRDQFPMKNYLSLSLESWTKVYSYKHDYPTDSFAAQMIRFLKLKQSLNGFTPSKNGSFWDRVGPDGFVRIFWNPYGSQSSRSQPGSRSFLFLKPAWMRSLCIPPPGKAIAVFDYGSEEFLLSAIWSACKAMYEAYKSGDVYLHYAKEKGLVPPDGKKEDYKMTRDAQKSVILGMSYLMSKVGLSAQLTETLKRQVGEDEAQEEIDLFNTIYSELCDKQNETQEDYYSGEGQYIKLPCGWFMWGDNENFRSVCNVGVQGVAGSIMRKAVELADARGLTVSVTLHDALYILYDSFDFKAIDTLHQCMFEAFIFYFTGEQKEWAKSIRLDGYTWSRDYPAPKILINKNGKEYKEYETIITPGGLEIEIGDKYVDERSEADYNKFSKYFQPREEQSL